MPDSIVCSPVLKMRFAPRHPVLVAIFLAVGFTEPLKAYAPLGHEIVGAMADERLANTPTAAKIRALLNGMTLEKAAVIPDEIKGWDKKGVDDPKRFHYAAYWKIDIQLRDFWRANQPTHDRNSVMPSHHWFHYTDVPVMQLEKYAEGQAGRSKWDVVHMIPYCVEILQGRVSEQNERRITKPVAVILLAHYVGDIHQPLHVGAQYFGAQGRVADPDKDSSCLPDEGGNTFTLELSDEPPRRRGMHKKTLHSFWDYDAVNALFPGVPNTLRKGELHEQIEPLKKQLVYEMASDEPRNWRMPANLEVRKYAEAWADEILPIAREAYERLKFTDVHPRQEEDRVLAAGEAQEKPMPDHIAYRAWATNVVGEELHKAGWRLADLLEKALR
jgi:S1/P1 Nuclease